MPVSVDHVFDDKYNVGFKSLTKRPKWTATFLEIDHFALSTLIFLLPS